MNSWFNRLWLAKTEGAARGPIQGDPAIFLKSERSLDTELPEDPDPLQMLDMKKACSRILQALEAKEKIFIHGDYDVDGLSSTALLSHYLRSLGADIVTFIPHRLDDGYGLSETGVAAARNASCTLLITVDCGIRSCAETKRLKELGIDTVITDHHEPGDELPEAAAVVDPKREGDPYPFKYPAGAGVAYLLCRSLSLMRHEETEKEDPVLAALAMLGTIADVMPLEGFNRRLTLKGLEAVKQNALPGISYMLQEGGCSMEGLSAKDLAFKVSPKLNAAGRMGRADPALAILQSRDEAEIRRLSDELTQVNTQRREEEASVMAALEEQIDENPARLARPILLFCGEDYHPGVLGIVAAKVREQYHKPAIIFTKANDETDERGVPLLKGSGRTEGAFDLLACLDQAKDYLYNYGGHVSACGLSVAEDKAEEAFSRLITGAAEQSFLFQEAVLPPDVDYLEFYDFMASADALTMTTYEQLRALEPFGKGNEEPVCLLTDLELLEIRIIGRDNTHLRLTVRGPEGPVQALAFGKAYQAEWLSRGDLISLAATFSLNEWQGRSSLQLMVKDILLPGEAGAVVPALGDRLKKPEREKLTPEDIVNYWRTLDRLLRDDCMILSLKRMPYILTAPDNCRYSLKQVESMHKIFLEAGLIEEAAVLNNMTSIIRRCEPAARVKLSDTESWQELLAEGGLEA